MGGNAVKTRTLQQAAQLLGGAANLRDYLRVPSGELADWLSGIEEPPMIVFLRAVDLILNDLDDVASFRARNIGSRAKKTHVSG